MVGIGGAENIFTLFRIIYKEVVIGACGIEGGLDGEHSGGGDGADGEAGIEISVVGRVYFCVGEGEDGLAHAEDILDGGAAF